MKTVGKGALELVSQDFYNIDDPTADQTPSMVIGDQMPINSQLFLWNGTSFSIETYAAETKTTPEGWTPDTAVLMPGVGFFMKVAEDAPEESYDIYMLGEVPGDNNNAQTTTVTKGMGFSLLGHPYPVEIAWTDTALAQSGKIDDQLFTWNQDPGNYSISTYVAETKTAPEGWNTNPTITPGQGFFYQTDESGTVDETKPYEFP
jgi:hypothetical protein